MLLQKKSANSEHTLTSAIRLAQQQCSASSLQQLKQCSTAVPAAPARLVEQLCTGLNTTHARDPSAFGAQQHVRLDS
jgi:hypothetical protein